MLILFLAAAFSSPVLCGGGTIVTHLPGFDGPLPFHLETGYVTVDEVYGAEYFYYFIRSERNPRDDPLLLWLSGGPGCSGFNGLAFEMGPLRFVKKMYDGSIPTLVYDNYSWTKISNIIFLDSPVGAGFSFSTNPRNYVADDTNSSMRIYEFLRKWFMEYQSFLQNPLYIAGDSYAGKIVPIVTHEIVKGIEAGRRPLLNLKGYVIGNPLTDIVIDVNSRVEYAHGMGIISDEHYEEIRIACEGEDHRFPNPLNILCISALKRFTKVTEEVYLEYILGPLCEDSDLIQKHLARERFMENYSEILMPLHLPDLECPAYARSLSYYWGNSKGTRKALNIKKATMGKWSVCNKTIPYIMNVPSSITDHHNVIRKGYRALIYSGDMDMTFPFVGTQAWIRSLDYPIIDDWRSWHVDGQVAGYTRKYSKDLTFATVKNAGHTAPEYQPKTCLAMFRRWISHEPL